MMQISTQIQNQPPVAFHKSFFKSQGECAREFAEAMRFKGIDFKEDTLADGKIHRFASGGRGDKDCWYVFYGMAGAFGDWSRDIHEKWSLETDPLPYAEKENLRHQKEKTRKMAEEEICRRQEGTALVALNQWRTLPETGQSPYLINKKVNAFGVRFQKDALVVPIRDAAGKLYSLQWIAPDGTKRFLTGGRKKGCFHSIGAFEEGKPVYVTEGYATGASVHMATHAPVVIAFDVGNLGPVVDALKRKYPKPPIIIAGDDDVWRETNTGRQNAEQAANKHRCFAVFPRFKSTESKPTDFNDLHVLEGLGAVKSQIEKHTQPSSQDWPEPKRLKSIKKDLSPVFPLPPAIIPEPYRAWLTDIAERMQCPLDYVAVAALVTTASLIGAGCKVRPKRHDTWAVVPNLWGGIVGRPSTMKSPSLKEIIKPLRSLEAEAYATFENEQQAYAFEEESQRILKEAIKKKMSKAAFLGNALNLNMAKQELKELKEPQPPVWKRYSTNDTTIEKMHELLSKNPRGLLLYRDELMGLLTSWDKEGHEADRSFYLEAWNGDDSKSTDRIVRKTTYTKNLCVSILGTIQPDKLLAYFQQTLSGFCNDGLLQRFQLLVYPDEAKDWQLVDKKPNIQAQEQASAIMKKLAFMNFCDYGATQEKEDTPYFCFTEEAQGIFFAWLTELEREKLTREDEPILIEHFAKYRKLMPALALIFHLINVADGKARGSITTDCVEWAAAWCDYLEAHARRIYGMNLEIAHQAARKLARKIQREELNGHFDVRDVYRKEWSLLRTREEVEIACSVLKEAGWLKDDPHEGSRGKNAYLINPKTVKRDPS
jgi:putative DNA primase/helicase